MSTQSWSARLKKKKGQQYIAVKIPRDEKLIRRIRQFEGNKWDSEDKEWLIPDTASNRERFGLESKVFLSKEQVQGISQFKYWLKSKRYSENTVKVYIDAMQVFLKFHHTVPISEFEEQHLVQFNNEYILKNKLSASWQNQAVNAIKLYFGRIEGTKMLPELIHRPRIEHRLPHVLSKDEVKRILNSCENNKHRMILSVIYACGLRRGELQKLELTDIDRSRMSLFIRQAKGKKDRFVPLSPVLLSQLEIYYKQYKPKRYLFEGQYPGEQYSDRSMANILKQALQRTGINSKATLHWLRHSYATHLMDKGTDIRFIQELLGHGSTRTTEIYTHVSHRNLQQIVSPFDEL